MELLGDIVRLSETWYLTPLPGLPAAAIWSAVLRSLELPWALKGSCGGLAMIVTVASLTDGGTCRVCLQCLLLSYKENDKDGYDSNVVKIGLSVGMCGLVDTG